ncbi:MAG TPA: hypothetical protein VNN08_09500 [Thermoanaerobaculia bacterium]|nr:hypothetical protein [Thermoanaerobaculia bacterium]
MNRRIRRLREQIERRGGQVHIDENLPDEIAEMFLREILTCPDCAAHARGDSVKQTGHGSGASGH